MAASVTLACKLRIERMLFPKTEFNSGDYVILSCSIVDLIEGEPYDHNRITIKGNVFSADINAVYQFSGSLENSKYGPCYKIDYIQQNFEFTNIDQKLEYLKSIMTDTQYQSIVQLPDPYAIIESGDVSALCCAKGIGKKSAKLIIGRFEARKQFAKVYNRLYPYGLSIDLITSLIAKYKDADQLLDRIESNPYILIKEVKGIGWVKADAIAAKVGITGADPRRVRGYVLHFMDKRADDGHTWCTAQEIWDSLSYDIGVDSMDVLRDALNYLHDDDTLYWPEDRSKIALAKYYELEKNIAHELYRIAHGELVECNNPDDGIKSIEEDQGWQFTEEQIDAVHMLADNNVAIVTGGAGTGKSTTVSAILKLLGNASFAQCALSGRAAARLTEVTGAPGQTIHRLLGFQQGEFVFNKWNQLPYNVIILDEISMVGASLFYDLIQAIPTGSKLIMLGDDGQLESIGLCNIFKDMLDSKVIPVSRLTKIHRQAAKSAIITESTKVRNGIQLCDRKWIGEETRGALQDLTLDVYSDSILTFENIKDHYQSLLEQGISKHKIQIVLPMKNRGEACTLKVNKAIQDIVNSKNSYNEIKLNVKNEYALRLGDRVICNQNMYKATHPPEFDEDEGENCPVFNGDRGVIKEIDSRHMIVDFDLWGSIWIDRENFNNIELGYALSCHKLQGSEADYIIVGFDMSSRVLLTKEWLYTAITRAKKKCILTCQAAALQYCISNSNIPYKRTFLREMLVDAWSN